MKVYELCFSPTGGTQKVANILSNALADEIVSVDLTDSTVHFDGITFDFHFLVIERLHSICVSTG